MNSLLSQLKHTDYVEANSIIKCLSGIVNFFSSEKEKTIFVSSHEKPSQTVREDRVSYGDWQTPDLLAQKVCKNHLKKFGNPEIVIEPTCGLGAFVFASLEIFPNLSEIHAIEINQHYVSDLKYKLLLNALRKPKGRHYPDIYIYNADFFKFDFSSIIDKCKNYNRNLAIIGNPPWVTNSRLGKNHSHNLPLKNNSYGLKGIDAITGKSNFDISEYITLQLLKKSNGNKGGISFLLKNSVIRAILEKQKVEQLSIGNIEQLKIDASSEFNVSVDASCFSAQFDCKASGKCVVKDFYTNSQLGKFGWVNNDSFVADIDLYVQFGSYDHTSTLVWRSGIKHDCSPVLELSVSDGIYHNGFGEKVEIEEDLLFPLLKSSDINNYQEGKFRKYLLLPQRKVGEDTSLLKHSHPLAYAYLTRYESIFDSRKSSIYKGKDKFSVFGVGDYSFKPYKIVVSSLYKTVNFILVSQYKRKPIVVDDTCYQLDFDSMEEAMSIYKALNSIEIQGLLRSLIFKDAKRVVTKNLLMRLDLCRWCEERGLEISKTVSKNPSVRQLSLFE